MGVERRRVATLFHDQLYHFHAFVKSKLEYNAFVVGGMLGLNTLECRRKFSIMTHYFSVLRGDTDNLTALSQCTIYVSQWVV